MMGLDSISERKILQIIDRDITTNLPEEGERDPLGYSIYAYFMIKNSIERPYTSWLVDWINSWIEKTFTEGFGRFLDRNVTALLFGYYTLATANRLKTKVDIEELIENHLPNYVYKNLFFGSLTHSIIILLSLAGMNVEIKKFENVLGSIIEGLRKGTLVNDPKNAVFAALLFEKLDLSKELRMLVESVSDKFESDDVFFDEKIYLSWVLWKYKSELRAKMPEITGHIKRYIENFLMSIGREEGDHEAISELYGGENNENRYSRILIGTALDLLVMIKKDRIIEIIPQFGEVTRALQDLGWDQVRSELEKAVRSFEESKYSDACNNLRLSFIMFLIKLYELFTGKEAPTEKGKTPNIKDILKPLKSEGLEPEEKGIITSTWSYLSEKAHIEKRGTEPLPDDVILGFRLTTSIMDFLMKKFLAQKGS